MSNAQHDAHVIWHRYDDSGLPHVPPMLGSWRIVRGTPKCVIVECYGCTHTVLKDTSGRRFCYPTQQLALNSYVIRKRRQIDHAKATLTHAEANLADALAMQRGEKPVRADKSLGSWPWALT